MGLVLACALNSACGGVIQPATAAVAVQVEVICPDGAVGRPLFAALQQDLKTDGYAQDKLFPMV
jgi:hypothetical protein